MTDSLAGIGVLIVDDEPLIAMDVAVAVENAGGHVIALQRSVEEAFDALDADCDGAIGASVLDVNLGAETSEGIASRLAAIDIPYILYTGNASTCFPTKARVVPKPAQPETIVAALASALSSGIS